MTHYPELNLDQVTVDPELIKRIPPALAEYYLALPLAQEDGHVSVALAHPDNATALATLRTLLQAEIVPVRSPSDDVRAALHRVYGLNGRQTGRILTWSAARERATAVQQAAAAFAQTQAIPPAVLDAGPVELEAALALAEQNHAALVILGAPVDRTVGELVSRCASPLLLVQGDYRPIKSVLVVARGYASDDQMLDWLEPLVRQQGARVTLLPLLDLPVLELDALFCTDGPAKRHLDHLLQRLAGAQMAGSLRVRAGDAPTQITAELRQDDYDLLVIAAEAHGRFVTRVLAALHDQGLHRERPILILKPTDLPPTTAGPHPVESCRADSAPQPAE